MDDVEAAVRQQLNTLELELIEKRQTRDRLKDEILSGNKEVRRLTRVLRAYGSPTGRAPAVVSDEQILEAVAKIEKQDPFVDGIGAAKVAEELGVEPRNVGRKLRKLVDAGQLKGTADAGYRLA
jgi:DNA-binding transcriptional ArsR family regulator